MEASPDRNAVALTHKELVCLQVGNLPVTVIPVYMAVVGCPISTLRNTCYSVAPFQKEPITRCPTTALVFDPRWPHTHPRTLWAARASSWFSRWPRAARTTHKEALGQGHLGEE